MTLTPEEDFINVEKVLGANYRFIFDASGISGVTGNVNVMLNDGDNEITTTINVIVHNDHSPIVTSQLPNQTMNEDFEPFTLFDLNNYFEDPDDSGNPLFFEIEIS